MDVVRPDRPARSVCQGSSWVPKATRILLPPALPHSGAVSMSFPPHGAKPRGVRNEEKQSNKRRTRKGREWRWRLPARNGKWVLRGDRDRCLLGVAVLSQPRCPRHGLLYRSSPFNRERLFFSFSGKGFPQTCFWRVGNSIYLCAEATLQLDVVNILAGSKSIFIKCSSASMQIIAWQHTCKWVGMRGIYGTEWYGTLQWALSWLSIEIRTALCHISPTFQGFQPDCNSDKGLSLLYLDRELVPQQGVWVCVCGVGGCTHTQGQALNHTFGQTVEPALVWSHANSSEGFGVQKVKKKHVILVLGKKKISINVVWSLLGTFTNDGCFSLELNSYNRKWATVINWKQQEKNLQVMAASLNVIEGLWFKRRKKVFGSAGLRQFSCFVMTPIAFNLLLMWGEERFCLWSGSCESCLESVLFRRKEIQICGQQPIQS